MVNEKMMSRRVRSSGFVVTRSSIRSFVFQSFEECGADPHNGRSLLNRDVKVAGHAHGEVLELQTDFYPPLFSQSVAKLSQVSERRPSPPRLVGVGSHAHQPDHSPSAWFRLFHANQLVKTESVFLILFAGIHL